MAAIKWDGTPSEPGFYATFECWDPEEGIFPGAHYWTGKIWIGRLFKTNSIGYLVTPPFGSPEEAEEYARANDPENPL